MIIPRPTRFARRPGWFTLPAVPHVSAGPGAEPAAELLTGYLGPDRPRGGEGPVIRLELDPGAAESAPEGYDLTITPERVDLRAPALAGLRHGVQTLRQLLPPETMDPATAPADAWRWPCVTVTDRPRLPWRGMMLDVARHYLPTGYLFDFVDQLALHKLNVLHLHLTDDQGWRMEIGGLPRLTEIGAWRAESMVGPAGGDRFDGRPHGGFYSRRDLRRLVAYAAARGVTVVPEIEMPGHARAALAAYPELGNLPGRTLPVWTSWGVSEDILGVHDAALEFCRRVLAEVTDVFPSPYVHVGGDECPTVQWERSPAARRRAAEEGLAGPRELRAWFLGRMRDFLAGRGRVAVCWDENGRSAGEPPPGMVLTAWREPVHGAEAVERGHQVVMGPHQATYFDYPQSDRPDEPQGQPGRIVTLADVYHYDPLAGGLPVADPDRPGTPGVLGTQGHVWTEFAPTPGHVAYLAYPRMCALAEVAWCAGPRDFADFRRRLAAHTRRLAAPGTPADGRSPTPRATTGTIDG
ncbi:beta-N-acetylhexosaminidase [Actinoallomurus acanthiterrae]